MKKIFLAITTAFISVVIATGSASAQHSRDTVIYAQNEKSAAELKEGKLLNVENSAVNGAGIENNTVADMKKISNRALKNFRNEFGKTDASWFKLSNGFVAYFTANNARNRTYYDKKGNWLYSTQYYDEKKLPKDTRAMVKSTYYDYSIVGAQEIRVPGKIIYLVHIKDDTSWKTIRVCDDEMDVIESFKNGL